MRRAVILPFVVAGLAGCPAAPPPVRTFEDFYSATVSKDVTTVRALLCSPQRAALRDVDDDELVRAFSVVKVLRAVRLESHGSDAAIVVAEDALGQTTRVGLQADAQAPRGWCVAVAGDAR